MRDSDSDAPPSNSAFTSGRYTRDEALNCVGPGWAPLIHLLFDRIECRGNVSAGQRPLPVSVDDVKEKFGGLRFYYFWLDEATNDAGEARAFAETVQLAESASYYLCERCGALGRPRRGGWILTMCDTHAAERG